MTKYVSVPRRFSDDEVKRHYREDDIVELTGEKGTIIAVDTSGLHKGKPVVNSERLVFQLEYCNNLYGNKYRYIQVNNNFSENFRRSIKKQSYTYSLFKTRL